MLVMTKPPTKKQLKALIELLKQYDDSYCDPLASAHKKMNKAIEFFQATNGNPSYTKQVISLLEALNK